MANEPTRHEHTKRIVCPFCGHVNWDSWEWNNGEEGDGETECGKCEDRFLVSRHVLITYSTRKP
jgi:transcription elongation factor Elf1